MSRGIGVGGGARPELDERKVEGCEVGGEVSGVTDVWGVCAWTRTGVSSKGCVSTVCTLGLGGGCWGLDSCSEPGPVFCLVEFKLWAAVSDILRACSFLRALFPPLTFLAWASAASLLSGLD
jgi:hypothetical protein